VDKIQLGRVIDMDTYHPAADPATDTAADTSPPAFPTDEWCDGIGDRKTIRTGGMTLRDWFAGQALSGGCGYRDEYTVRAKELAKQAYLIADQMLKCREGAE
jgi:hypothetical protein